MSLLSQCLAFWKYDISSGNPVDSVSGMTLTNVNTVTFSPTNAKIGNAANFAAASSQRLSVASNATLERGVTSYSWATWYRTTTVAAGESQVLAKYSSSADRQYRMFRSAANVGFVAYIGTTNQSVTSATTISTNTWVFLVGGYDASANKTFISVNGAAKELGAAHSGTTVLGSTGEFNVGCLRDGVGYGDFVDGIIDLTGLFSGVLTDAQILELYNSGAGLNYPFSNANGLLLAY